MGRRRRRVIRIVKKKLPTVFVCPRCGEEAVRVTIAKDTGKAAVMCAMCQLKDEFQAHPAAQMIDVYSYFADRFYGVKDPRAIIPHEREAPKLEAEEMVSESEAVEAAIEPSEPDQMKNVENVKSPEEDSQPGLPTDQGEAVQPSTLIAEDKPTEKFGETIETSKESETLETQEASVEGESASEDDSEPFADILQSKDKKRYSSNPLPEQPSE